MAQAPMSHVRAHVFLFIRFRRAFMPIRSPTFYFGYKQSNGLLRDANVCEKRGTKRNETGKRRFEANGKEREANCYTSLT